MFLAYVHARPTQVSRHALNGDMPQKHDLPIAVLIEGVQIAPEPASMAGRRLGQNAAIDWASRAVLAWRASKRVR